MANTVISLRSSGVTANTPSLGVLANGELSLNFADGILYYKTSSNSLGSIYTTPPAGLNQEIQFNDSGSFGGNSSLTFNKTTGLLSTNNLTANSVATTSYVQFGDGTKQYTANSGVASAFAQANAAFAQANSNYISAVTRLDVTHSGSSAYLIDQYSGNNPAIYVIAGETIAFYLNVTGHPFMIRVSSGGANYSTGLIHVATDGTVSTDSSAQGKVTGTLYWKVPAVLAGNTYVYQCSHHSGMVGNINIGQPNSTILTHANEAFNKANSANVLAQGSFDKANSANVLAQASFDKANSANVLAQGSFDKANSANVLAQSAFDKANQTAQLAFTTVSANGTNLVADANNDTLTITSTVANGIFVTGIAGTDTLDIGLIDSGVTASGYGSNILVPTFVVDTKGRLTSVSNTTIRSATTTQTGIVQLEDSVTSTSTSNAATPASVKTAYDLANTANVTINSAFSKANSANSLAQQAFDFANTISGGAATDNVARTTSTAAFNHANGAFDKANTDFTNISTTAGVYGNASHVPVITLSANGRISNVINTQVDISTTQVTSGIFAFGRGGTNATSYTTGALLVSNGSSIISLANTGTAGTYGNSTFVPVITTDAYGRISSVTNTAIDVTGSGASIGDVLALSIALG